MDTTTTKQGPLTAVTPDVRRWVDGFLLAKRTEVAGTTLVMYRDRLRIFLRFCEARGVRAIEAIDAGLLREYLLHLEQGGHNPGGLHQHYRIIRAFLYWFEREAAPEGWRNPIKRVKAPRLVEIPLDPVDIESVRRLARVCGGDLLGLRDRAIFLVLLDAGLRASELCGLDVSDFDPVTGALMVRKGKGGKVRVTFAGRAARKAVRAYLRERGAGDGPLFATQDGERFGYFSLRSMVTRRAKQAGIVPVPSLHSFRRAFALAMLRGGADLLSLQKLLGHADLSLLKRYVKQNADDLRAAHVKASPVDSNL